MVERDPGLAATRAPAGEHVALLRARAAALARHEAEARAAAMRAVLFELAGEHYAVDASSVLRVLTLRELTPLPGAAPPLYGVTHWRGTVLTLLDIRPLLGAAAPGITDLARVIVLRGEDRDFGIVADRARDMVELEPQDIRPLPGGDDDAGGTLLRGVTPGGVFVIDVARLLERFGRRRRGQQGTG